MFTQVCSEGFGQHGCKLKSYNPPPPVSLILRDVPFVHRRREIRRWLPWGSALCGEVGDLSFSVSKRGLYVFSSPSSGAATRERRGPLRKKYAMLAGWLGDHICGPFLPQKTWPPLSALVRRPLPHHSPILKVNWNTGWPRYLLRRLLHAQRTSVSAKI